MKRTFIGLSMLLLTAAGCSQESTADLEAKEVVSQQERKQPETKADENNEKKEVNAVPVTKRVDQGNYHVVIEGNVHLNDAELIVTGTTNLLPGSKLFLYTDAMDGIIIGGSNTTLVNEDGSFQLKQNLPDGYDDPSIYTRIVFHSAASNEEITSHYQESGNPLTGPFVRLYEEGHEVRKEISVITEVPLDKPERTVPIEEPRWEKPADYGSPNIWIEAEVQEDEEFVYISGKSNLLEGAALRGDLHLEGYITSGFSDQVNVNPDGSFKMTIPHPKRKIDDVKGYEIRIAFSPTDANSFAYIYDTYGKKGENLQGNFVVSENEENSIVYVMKVQY